MDLKEIQALIKFVSKSGAQEVSLETEDFKINIKTASGAAEQPTIIQAVAPQAAMPVAAAPATPAAPVAPEVAAASEDDNGNYIEVKSPMIGTLYRSPSPEQDAFVKVGSEIKPGDVLCIVEAMKLFNEIESEVSGKIVKVLVDDQSPIEYDQPLFLVDPS
ncbi:acetyl-CoA carboxylase biotin carboxyl carrier protein [Schleiferiaceae bacterium]|jgi:acetyl-CoA carboxylase biotin carboxyl carrier protein|nr:acetyl-CoA carboxylase biotin carboxyl carrier protein [Schleiferiaceae bacterium]MDA8570511.1 acetyl-CoA carboxylase biotin carboxyl carrier protein [Schleiferiaceae bacterium]PSR06916.1 MAG: acetyl-CoA carboxylase biotin carboxyl carrier protein [Bacteroidota bacterium]